MVPKGGLLSDLTEFTEFWAAYPRWRFTNLWRKPDGFCLLNVWWIDGLFGLTVLNFAMEYNSRAKR